MSDISLRVKGISPQPVATHGRGIGEGGESGESGPGEGQWQGRMAAGLLPCDYASGDGRDSSL